MQPGDMIQLIRSIIYQKLFHGKTTDIEKDGYLISTDAAKLDLTVIHQYLSRDSYWAQNIPLEVVERSVANSFCFGIYHNNQQVGFARLITDKATFAYLADVFILPEHRGKGLSKWLMTLSIHIPKCRD
jgi:GNAT superfamily N-acetyltransferase